MFSKAHGKRALVKDMEELYIEMEICTFYPIFRYEGELKNNRPDGVGTHYH